MKYTVSLKNNKDFKRLYRKGKTAAHPVIAVYCRRNGKNENRIGLSVSVKLGDAVWRNRVKRRMKEAYRLNEDKFLPGYDIILVGRKATHDADFLLISGILCGAAEKLGFLRK